MKICPDLEQLQRLLAEQLPPSQRSALETHIETCRRCQQTLERLTGDSLLLRSEPVGNSAQPALLLLRRQHPEDGTGSIPSEVSGMIAFACAGCGKQLQVEAELVGKKVRCPSCGGVMTNPASSARLEAASAQPGKIPLPAGSAPRSSEPRSGSDTVALPPGQSVSVTPLAEASSGGEILGVGSERPSDKSATELTEFLGPAQSADELGRLGPYRVLAVLGHGGMGVVFRAQDPQLARLVALKAMLPTVARQALARERFFREAKAAATLKHPNIVTIYQVSEERGVPYLAMEFLEGEPLDARIAREGKLAIPEIVRLGARSPWDWPLLMTGG